MPSRRDRGETRLQQFLARHGIASARVESKLRDRLAGRAPSRQQMLRWRRGRSDIRRIDMVRILWAVRQASDNPNVRIEQLFDLDPANPANWED